MNEGQTSTRSRTCDCFAVDDFPLVVKSSTHLLNLICVKQSQKATPKFFLHNTPTPTQAPRQTPRQTPTSTTTLLSTAVGLVKLFLGLSPPGIVHVKVLLGDLLEQLLGEAPQDAPRKIKRLENGARLVRPLRNEFVLELLQETQIEVVFQKLLQMVLF